MSYQYEANVGWLSTPDGVKAVGEAIRNVETRLDPAGAAMMCHLWPSAGDSWQMMAAVDHLVALGMIEEIQQARQPAGQYRVFRRVRR